MDRFLEVGDVIEIKKGMPVNIDSPKDRILAIPNVPDDYCKTLVFAGKTYNFSDEKTIDTSYLLGDYVVINIEMKEMNCLGRKLYQNVICKKLNDGEYDKNGIEVSFSQTPTYSATICPDHLELKKKMEKMFV